VFPNGQLAFCPCNLPIFNILIFFSISQYATADEYTDTTIRVITIEKRQYGKYTCKAANKLGTAEAQVELFGMYRLNVLL